MQRKSFHLILLLVGCIVFIPLLVLQAFPTQSPTHDYALVVGDRGSFYYFDGRSLIPIPISTHENLTSVEWRHDSNYALVVGSNGIVVKYDGTSSNIISSIPKVNFQSVSWSPNDSQALIVGIDRSSGKNNGVMYRFDGKQISRVLALQDGGFNSVDWNPNGSYALVVGFSTKDFLHGIIGVYDGHSLKDIPVNSNDTLNTVSWSPNGKYALIGGDIHGLTLNTTLFRYDDTKVTPLDTSKCCFTNDAHTTQTITFSQDSHITLVNGNKGLVIQYNPDPVRARDFVNFQDKLEDLHHIGDFYTSQFVPGTHIAYAAGGNGTVARISDDHVVLLTQKIGMPSLRSLSITTKYNATRNMVPLYVDPPKTTIEETLASLSAIQQPLLLTVFLSLIPIVMILGSRGKDIMKKELSHEFDPIIRPLKSTFDFRRIILFIVNKTTIGLLFVKNNLNDIYKIISRNIPYAQLNRFVALVMLKLQTFCNYYSSIYKVPDRNNDA